MRPVIAVDPGRMSGIAFLVPCRAGSGRMYLTTRLVRVDEGVDGLLGVRKALIEAVSACVAAGWKVPDIEWVIEAQHVRFASAAIVVTEVRRTWEVYIYEIAQVLPERLHPSEWRAPYGLNSKGAGNKKDAARETLDKVLGSPSSKVFEMVAAPQRRRTSDEVEAALMALSRTEVV